MKAVVRPNRARRSFGRIPFPPTVIAAVCIALVASALPSFGFWLPWAKEEDKIAKRLDEIWAAVLLEDRKMLGTYVLGDGAQTFIDQEIAHAKMMKVKSYKSRVEKADLDPTTQQFAFADVTRTATHEDGGTTSDRSLRVLKKVNRDWKLIVDIPQNRRTGNETSPRAAQSTDQKRFDSGTQPLPSGAAR